MKIAVVLCAALLLSWLIFPTNDIVQPDWNVLITDLQDQPIAGATVHADSQQYTLESTECEESSVTGPDGRVHFNRRVVRANGFMRIAGVTRNLGQGVHASFGVHTWLVAFKSGYGEPGKLEDFAFNERQATASGSAIQSSHLRLQRCSEGYSGMGCSFPDDPSKPVLPLKRD